MIMKIRKKHTKVIRTLIQNYNERGIFSLGYGILNVEN